jgi:hypothetical protein
MIDPSLIGDLTKEHAKALLTRDEAKAFLKDLMEVCHKHDVFLRTSDKTLKFSRAFEGSGMRTLLRAYVDKAGNCPAAKIEYK